MSDDLDEGPIDYERLKAATRTLRRSITTLYALAAINDPFGALVPRRRKGAEWITALWPLLGFRPGVHIRRVHYQLVSMAEPIRQHNGRSYENTEACWGMLVHAIREARFLGLLDPSAIVDRRNPAPMIYTTPEPDINAAIETKNGFVFGLPPEANLPEFTVRVEVDVPEAKNLPFVVAPIVLWSESPEAGVVVGCVGLNQLLVCSP
jgi:hypothetical protein